MRFFVQAIATRSIVISSFPAMAQFGDHFEVNDVVTVHSLVRRPEYNGCQGIVVQAGLDRAIIRLLDQTMHEVEYANLRHGIYNMPPQESRFCGLARVPQVPPLPLNNLPPPIVEMEWRSLTHQEQFLANWQRRIRANGDGMWLDRRAQGDVHRYLIIRLSHRMSRYRHNGQAAWAFQGTPLHLIRCGCIFSQGGREQDTPRMPNELGEWWPIIFANVSGDGVLYPSYCPGLAWQQARPWFAHSSRMAIVPTPTPIFEELSDTELIENTWTLLEPTPVYFHTENRPRSR